MESGKRFIFAVIKHLQQDLSSGLMTEDAQESVEVAIQCLQQAYCIDASEQADIAKYNVSQPILQIFNNGCAEASSSQRSQPVSSQSAKSAEQHKLDGNDRMKADDYRGAVECYTRAITLDEGNAIFHCNRAAAYTKLNRNDDAISDCLRAIRLDPNYGRAYGRIGLAYLNLENYQKAVESYEKALQLDSGNPTYQANLKIAKDKLQGGSGPAAAPSMPGMPNLAGLDFGSLLANPAVMNMAQSFMQNPQMQQMFGSMMGGAAGGEQEAAQAPPTQNPSPGSAQTAQLPSQASFGDMFQATQQFARQMQETNPELVDQLKSQFQQGAPDPDKKPEQ